MTGAGAGAIGVDGGVSGAAAGWVWRGWGGRSGWSGARVLGGSGLGRRSLSTRLVGLGDVDRQNAAQFCPPLAIRYGSPDRKVKEKRMEDTFRSLDRAIISFFLAYAGLTYANAILLAEESHLQALFTAGPTMIMAIAIRFHCKKWRDTLDNSGSVSTDPDQRLMDKLKRWTDTLVMEPSAPRR